MISARPIRLLIAALGGEGGGVLTQWIVAAADAEGLPIQSTSIPGVAQRTGATTYYIELSPVPASSLGGRTPVFALTPSAGDLDLMVASELLEAGRAIGNGFLAKTRTTLIASTHRVYAMTEKMAAGDGRYDTGQLLAAIEASTAKTLLFDAASAAREAGAAVNAVLLGAIAGSGVLPIATERFEDAIRAEGKSVEANLRGFHAGLGQARGEARAATVAPGKRPHADLPGIDDLLARAGAELPSNAAALAAEGVKRLVHFQDAAYAALYLDRLARVAAVERSLGGDGTLTRETARHLGVRMSFEDIIRVAQLKTERARFERIAREVGGKEEEPLVIVDFFKPGVEELASILPPRLARWLLAVAEKHGWTARAYLGMHVRSSSVLGFARLRLLALLRPWRRRSFRFEEEQAALETWLGRIVAAARLSLPLAAEIVQCARLVRGYGETHRRGIRNYARIEDALIDPALAGALVPGFALDAIASARTAALADPEGDGLARTLAEIEARREAA